MTVADVRLARLMDRIRAKPDFRPTRALLASVGLTEDDLPAVRAGTWTPPPSPLEAAVDAAVRAHLAPVKAAVEATRDALQAVADAPPHQADIPEAVQTIAAATIAIADALPVENTSTPPDQGPPA